MQQSETLWIVGGFLLRLGVPVAATILVTWLLHRLDAHWRRQPPAIHPTPLAASGGANPGVAYTATPPSKPCWEVKGCSAESRANCEACAQPSVACWLLLLRRDGRLPAKCRCCEVFNAGAVLAPTGAD